MRRVYLLSYSEDVGPDERVLDALVARGLPPSESGLENPVCPVCGASTLVAFVDAAGDFQVVVAEHLEDEGRHLHARAWFLICNEIDCHYEEPVERVTDPVGAILFDLHTSYMDFDEAYCSGNPEYLKQLAAALRERSESSAHRKYRDLSQVIQDYYDLRMEDIHNWLNQVPKGYPISFSVAEKTVTGHFLLATPAGMLVEVTGQLVMVPSERLCFFGPRRFPPSPEPLGAEQAAKGEWIRLMLDQDWVVIKGHHLRLNMVDRLGAYHCATTDAQVGAALALETSDGKYFTGVFRSAQIEARYTVIREVRIRGHWVHLSGTTSRGQTHVTTVNPEVARALGLNPQYANSDADGGAPSEPANWAGSFDPAEIEGQREVRQYHWPLPESGTR